MQGISAFGGDLTRGRYCCSGGFSAGCYCCREFLQDISAERGLLFCIAVLLVDINVFERVLLQSVSVLLETLRV